MNRAICLALALAAMFAVAVGMMLLPPPEFDAFGISLAERAPRFNESKASAEPVKWQNELQDRCVKRAGQVARPQLSADQVWAYEPLGEGRLACLGPGIRALGEGRRACLGVWPRYSWLYKPLHRNA
jgi:hypothetical protein